MPPLVSVVVLNYNSRDLLETCLRSLLDQQPPASEVILVDNASIDGSVDYVRREFPFVRIIENSQNVGFAAGNNVGIRNTQGEYLFLVNPDTECTPTALAELVAPMLEQATVGMTAPKVLQFYRREHIDSAGLVVDRAGIGWNFHRGERDHGNGAVSEVFGASAGAALYRRSMLDEIGLFDDDYFAYYEDVDLAWRARLAGWRCLYVPRAVVYHIHGASFAAAAAQRLYLLGRNKWWTILKDYPFPQILLYLPWIVFADWAAVAYSIFWRRELHSLRGRLAAIPALPRVLAQRRRVQRNRKVQFRELAKFMK